MFCFVLIFFLIIRSGFVVFIVVNGEIRMSINMMIIINECFLDFFLVECLIVCRILLKISVNNVVGMVFNKIKLLLFWLILSKIKFLSLFVLIRVMIVVVLIMSIIVV